MAKASKPARSWSDDDDDEFPDLETLAQQKVKERAQPAIQVRRPQLPSRSGTSEGTAKAPSTIRRRKLGPLLSDTTLLRAWTPEEADQGKGSQGQKMHAHDEEPQRSRIELRTRKSKPVAVAPQVAGESDDYMSGQEISIIEDLSEADDTPSFSSDSGDEPSEFEVAKGEDDDGDDDDGGDDNGNDSLAEFFSRWPRTKPGLQVKEKKPSAPKAGEPKVKEEEGEEQAGPATRRARRPLLHNPTSERQPAKERLQKEPKPKKAPGTDLADTFSRLRIDAFDEAGESEGARSRPKLTPPNTPPKPSRGLVSPKKMPRIPATPHQPSSDIFWSREFVDEWNDEHSPRKQLFPDATKRSPEKHSPEKKKASTKTATDRESKKAFEQAKHDTAEKFLGELDTVITGGKLSELAASTGGIKLKWTNKLNTTAGRANWKRETIRSSHKRGDPAAGGAAAGGATAPDGTTTVVQHNHYASIELAEKVIDDEHRLLNVMAHEFCHLANFMVSGITKNPHGKEFKAWAAKCSRAFGDRGIEVTTKHSYDIDFKYVWQCTACSLEFKRHSKSIDPGRHRCGSCKSELRQIKPAPRAASAKPSEYQAFMKVQMKLMKEENPKSPQKDIMKLVASKWAQKGGGAAAAASGRSVSPADSGNSSSGGFRDVSKDLENLVAIEDD